MNRIDFRSATVDADDMIREEDLVGTDNIVLILIIPTKKVNMYFNRLVLTKLLKYMLAFLVGMAFSS